MGDIEDLSFQVRRDRGNSSYVLQRIRKSQASNESLVNANNKLLYSEDYDRFGVGCDSDAPQEDEILGSSCVHDNNDCSCEPHNLRNISTTNRLTQLDHLESHDAQIIKVKTDIEYTDQSLRSTIPATQIIYLKTWGCSHNSSDSEYMAGQLAAYGYKITSNKTSADLWILNSCTVKNPAEDHFRNEINAAKILDKKIVVAGCVPQGAPKSSYIKGLSMIGVQQIDRIVEVVEETLKGNSVQVFGVKKVKGKKLGGSALSLPKIRRNPLIEIIAVNTGCLNQCTYCKTKHARGDLGSYSIEEIVERASQSFEEGVVEIWLTSEDTGAYGRDIGVTLPHLLYDLIEVIPDGCMLRVGMTNPPYILEHLDNIAELLNHPKVYSFLHVPVQSGSDGVLMDMKREYCSQDFCQIVDFLKDKVPNVNIATDIICGFPTETDEDFQDTMNLVSKYKFASLFINQFFPRPGTPAARMRQIPKQTVKERTKALSNLFQSYLPYDHQIGQIQRVLVTETSTDGQYWVGHNKSYDQVLVPKLDGLLGENVQVKIISAGKHHLMSRLHSEPYIFVLCKGYITCLKNINIAHLSISVAIFYLGFKAVRHFCR